MKKTFRSLDFKVLFGIAAVIATLIFCNPASAQQGVQNKSYQVSGVIKDEAGLPLVGVTIVLRNNPTVGCGWQIQDSGKEGRRFVDLHVGI